MHSAVEPGAARVVSADRPAGRPSARRPEPRSALGRTSMSLFAHVQVRMHLRAAAVAPALAASLILTLASPSLAAQPTPPGSGAPPRSFWGNTGAIPPATHVLEVEVINRTNGRFPASRVYWSFNGQEKSIARQHYIDMPANSAGRMYFYLGSPHSKYFDFIEFTVGPSSINVDTTRVDRFGLKLALLLHGHDGSSQEVGENYATFTEGRTATFQRFQNAVPADGELATDNAPYG